MSRLSVFFKEVHRCLQSLIGVRGVIRLKNPVLDNLEENLLKIPHEQNISYKILSVNHIISDTACELATNNDVVLRDCAFLVNNLISGVWNELSRKKPPGIQNSNILLWSTKGTKWNLYVPVRGLCSRIGGMCLSGHKRHAKIVLPCNALNNISARTFCPDLF